MIFFDFQECHDSFFAALAEKKASYECFLPTCSTKFWTQQERRDHAITSHDFPPDFRFDGAKPTSNQKKPNKKQKRSMSLRESKMDVDLNGDNGLNKKDNNQITKSGDKTSSIMEVDGETSTVSTTSSGINIICICIYFSIFLWKNLY